MMRTKTTFTKIAAVLLASLSIVSCDEEQSTTKTPDVSAAKESYVVAATVAGQAYLVQTPSLDEGVVDLKNNGLETIDAAQFIFHGTDYLFTFQYNKGGDGKGESFYLNSEGKLTKRFSNTYSRTTTYGVWKEFVIGASTGDGNVKDAEGLVAKSLLFNKLSSVDGSQKQEQVLAENFLGNGEFVHFAGFEEANGKLYTAVVPGGMSAYGVKHFADKIIDTSLVATKDGGSGSGSFKAGTIPSTQYPDHAYVAIYTDSFDEKPVIAHTDKMGFACGRRASQYYQTIWAADNGDVYVFSPGFGRTFVNTPETNKVTGKHPSAVMRIKKGTTQFDESYYVNIESLGNKLPMFKCWHISGTKFLLQMYDGAITDKNVTTLSLAIYDGNAKTLIPVKGLPVDLNSFGSNPVMDKGFCYMPVSVSGGGFPALYKIDANSGEASKGLEIRADAVSAVGKLAVK